MAVDPSLLVFRIQRHCTRDGHCQETHTFSLAWWALVFPNTAFVLATSLIGEELDSEGIEGVASAMTILIVLAWFVVMFSHIRAVMRSKLLWPGRDENFGHYNPQK